MEPLYVIKSMLKSMSEVDTARLIQNLSERAKNAEDTASKLGQKLKERTEGWAYLESTIADLQEQLVNMEENKFEQL